MFSREQFLEKYQKVPVTTYQNQTSKEPLVSICVQTYKQSAYIAECLDGILMQKTDFDFEILLGEDDSPDGTREICIEYAKNFPDKIKLFLHSRENNIEIYGRPSARFNIRYNMYHAKGKYLALCEGDDFWTDPLKLQKQIDFLEKDEDYGLVYSDIDLISGNSEGEMALLESLKERYFRIKELYKSGHIFWDLLEKNLINTLTVCVRKELILDYLNNFWEEEFSYDHRLWMHVASYSKIKYIDEKWGTYRVLNQGISRSGDFFDKRDPLVKQSALLNYMAIVNYNTKLIDKRIFSKVSFNILKSNKLSIEEKKPINIFFRKHPLFFSYLFLWKVNKLINKIKF